MPAGWACAASENTAAAMRVPALAKTADKGVKAVDCMLLLLFQTGTAGSQSATGT